MTQERIFQYEGNEIQWVSAWYRYVRTLPATAMLESSLSVTVDPTETRSGWYSEHLDKICVVAGRDQWDTLATLLHETAHALSWGRCKTPHVAPWERSFLRLTSEFLALGSPADHAVRWLVEIMARRELEFKQTGRSMRRSAALEASVAGAIRDARPFLAYDPLEEWVWACVSGRKIGLP